MRVAICCIILIKVNQLIYDNVPMIIKVSLSDVTVTNHVLEFYPHNGGVNQLA